MGLGMCMRIYDLPGLGGISAQLFAGGCRRDTGEVSIRDTGGRQGFRVSLCGRTTPIRPVKCLAQRKIFAGRQLISG